MGNFYSNITLPVRDTSAVAAVLTGLRRDAWVAVDRDNTVVFDQRCDEQDVGELEHLAVALSQRLQCGALAVCNHDDDVLSLVVVASGSIIDRYDSNPGYFDGRQSLPTGGNAAELCALFGVPDRRSDAEQILRADHAEYVVEFDRHRALQVTLGLPERLSFLGYRYVTRGELAGDPVAATLQRVGADQSSPAADAGARSGAFATHLAVQSPTYERSVAAMQAESPDVFWNAYALALGESAVAERWQPLFRVARGNGGFLFMQLREYVITHRLVGPDGWIRADDLLADFLGEREFNQLALGRLLLRALGLPPLTADQIAAFQRGDRELLERLGRAMSEATRASDPDFGTESDEEPE